MTSSSLSPQQAKTESAAKKKESNGTDDKGDCGAKKEDEDRSESNHGNSSEAVAKIAHKKTQGDQELESEANNSKQEETENGVASETPAEPKGRSGSIFEAGTFIIIQK